MYYTKSVVCHVSPADLLSIFNQNPGGSSRKIKRLQQDFYRKKGTEKSLFSEQVVSKQMNDGGLGVRRICDKKAKLALLLKVDICHLEEKRGLMEMNNSTLIWGG